MEGGSFRYFLPANLTKKHEDKPLLIYFTTAINDILSVLLSQSKHKKMYSINTA
jgi:hypothetical protein